MTIGVLKYMDETRKTRDRDLEQSCDIAVLGARLWVLRPAQQPVGKLSAQRLEDLDKLFQNVKRG